MKIHQLIRDKENYEIVNVINFSIFIFLYTILLLIQLKSRSSLTRILDEKIDLVCKHHPYDHHARGTQHEGEHAHVNLKRRILVSSTYLEQNTSGA